MKPPVHIVAALKNYDPLLRIRFSQQVKRWVLERKCNSRFLKRPVRYVHREGVQVALTMSRDSDLSIQFHDGYVGLMTLPYPTMEVLAELYRTDTSRQGRYYVHKLDEEHEKAERERERKMNAHLRELSEHAWEDVHMAGSRELSTLKKFRSS